ncbi:MAG: hypothetical protein WAM04_12440 [Candidatus Sulfotelmatobacter sp.]
MKAALVLLLFAASAFAQDQSAIVAAQAACGAKDVKFDAKQNTTQHPTPQPESGKALVYVIGDLGLCSDCSGGKSFSLTDVDDAVVKVGMDGGWVGAIRGSSYLFFPAEPGAHHLCLNWQSSLAERSRAFAMTNLSAEAGTIYYFRARLFPGRSGDYFFDLDPVNADEGKYLVASSALSVSHSKK